MKTERWTGWIAFRLRMLPRPQLIEICDDTFRTDDSSPAPATPMHEELGLPPERPQDVAYRAWDPTMVAHAMLFATFVLCRSLNMCFYWRRCRP